MKTFIKLLKKITALALVLSALMIGANTYAQVDDEDTTIDEETLLPPVANPTSQPVIIDDNDSSAASEVEYEE